MSSGLFSSPDHKVLKATMKLFLEFIKSFNHNYATEEENDMDFQFLTPSKNAERIEIYIKALYSALGNDDVKNIAISGVYGSGKSSFIKTFESKNKNQNYHFLDISLATFKKDEKDLSLIEKSILQQIFYKVKQKSVPFSRFKRIGKIEYIKLKTAFILMSLLALLFFVDSKYLEFLKTEDYALWIKYFSFFVLLVWGFIFIKSIIKNLTGITLEKLNLQNLEITTNKPDENSLLNKYLDEIIYFFSETKYNIVVFQDLDRFDNVEIFTKLRELNNFLNNSEQINQKYKKIVFLYAIKDEMFKEKDSRTKFFDFMIPMIPYVNSSTSYDKLLEFFDNYINENSDLIEKKKSSFKEFLRNIALYINDMRLLKNIYNEHLIYDKKIGEKLDKVKLLAMMVYKNFYPEDFSLLHKDDGVVFSIFKNKYTYIKDLDTGYTEDILNIKDRITKIRNEEFENIEDLRKVYIYTIMNEIKNNPPFLRIFDNNQNFDISFENATQDDYFEKIQSSSQIRHPSGGSFATTFTSIEDKLSEFSYNEREQFIRDKQNNNIEKLNEEIKEITEKQKALNLETLAQLCDKKEIQERIKQDIEEITEKQKALNLETLAQLCDKKEIQERIKQDIEVDTKSNKNDLLYFLLINGHIDENYFTFLSYSFDKSLTKTDTEYLKNVISKNELPFDYKLTNTDELVNKLNFNEFLKPSILNYNLVNFLIENKSKYKEKYEITFRQLSNNSDKSKKFIFEYLNILPTYNNFIENIVSHWKDFWKYVYSNSDFDSQQQEDIFYKLIYSVQVKNIIALNIDKSLKNYIENLEILRDLVDEHNQKMQEIIASLKIKFSKLNELITNTPLFAFIYNNNHYTLNELMIEQIIFTRYAKSFGLEKEQLQEKLSTQNLTTIKELDKDKKLTENIEQNIAYYIDDIFLKLEDNKHESEEIIIWLLNNEGLSDEQKKSIIKSQNIIIEDISKIKSDAQQSDLLLSNKVKATWDNVGVFYKNTEELTESLIDFLNIENNATNLAKVKINEQYRTEHKNFNTSILKEILESNQINLEIYKVLMKSYVYWYENLDISHLDEEKIDAVINGGRLKLSKDNITNLINYSNSKHINLIQQQFNEFINQYDELSSLLDEKDKIKLLNLSILNLDQKFNLLEKIGIDSLNIDKEVAEILCQLYLDKKIGMDTELFNKVISQLPIKQKLDIFISQSNHYNFTCEEICTILDDFTSPYNELCQRIGSFKNIENTHTNETFANILYRKNCISTYKIKNKYIRINRHGK